MIEKVNIIYEDKSCIAYDCDTSTFIRLKQGGTASDHTHVEFILNDTTREVNAPAKITIPPKAYHKFTALTDVVGLEIR
ncbi:MAG: hypothetical protein ABH859_02190 [Pseudomonadota bacterium]